MSLNLFQKYRPPTFKDVVGHETTIKELQQRAKDRNFPQCIYITGFTGTGKTVISRIIVKSLLCQNLDVEGNPCEACKICEAVDNEQKLLNYFEENGSNCNIDRMREIEEISQKKIMLSDSSVKVFYIDELQELAGKSSEALKNLLKLLEKPSKNNYFILGSMDDSKIPVAVKNRCVTYKLKLLTVEQIADRLAFICGNEGIVLDEEKSNVVLSIAQNSQGSLRTAISYLERCIYGNIWTEKEAIKELEIFSDLKTNEFITNLLCGKADSEYIEVNRALIDIVIYRLNFLYRALTLNNLNGYQKSLISGIDLPVKGKENNKVFVEQILLELYELLKYNYVSTNLIEFKILYIKNVNKRKIDEIDGRQLVLPRVPRKEKT